MESKTLSINTNNPLSIYNQNGPECSLYRAVQSGVLHRVGTTSDPSKEIVSARDVFVFMADDKNRLLNFKEILDACITTLSASIKDQIKTPDEVIQFYLNQFPQKQAVESMIHLALCLLRQL